MHFPSQDLNRDYDFLRVVDKAMTKRSWVPLTAPVDSGIRLGLIRPGLLRLEQDNSVRARPREARP